MKTVLGVLVCLGMLVGCGDEAKPDPTPSNTDGGTAPITKGGGTGTGTSAPPPPPPGGGGW